MERRDPTCCRFRVNLAERENCASESEAQLSSFSAFPLCVQANVFPLISLTTEWAECGQEGLKV